ncbi:FAD-binding oxidoreductase, partial [Mesorhizobium sp. M2D.F.Ca.ET.145.01.1.1]
MSPETQRLLSALGDRLGAGGVLAGSDVDQRYRDDPDGKLGLLPEVVLRPRDTVGVAAALAGCNALCQPVVIQGGRTGLAGGTRVQSGEIVLSLERMNGLAAPDIQAASIVAEAGATLQAVQEAADG